MKILGQVLTVLFIYLGIGASAQINNNTDSLKLSFKQDKQYFLDNYAKDDTSKALINYFFRNRKTAFYETVIPPIAAGVSALLISRFLNLQDQTAGPDSGYGLAILGPLAIFGVLGSGVFLLDGQIRWLRFSRHRLLALLNSYNSGKQLSKSMRRKIKLEIYNLTHPNPKCFACFFVK